MWVQQLVDKDTDFFGACGFFIIIILKKKKTG